MNRSLSRSLALHRQAADDFIAAAAATPPDAWLEPLAEGKWSPGEVAAHLVTTYDTVIRELRGGEGMAIRTKLLARIVLRLTMVPRILAGKGFPKGAVAPRETRPSAALARDEGLALFRERAAEFEEAAKSARPGQKLTHAYFGAASVADGVLLCARHIQHHRAQLG